MNEVNQAIGLWNQLLEAKPTFLNDCRSLIDRWDKVDSKMFYAGNNVFIEAQHPDFTRELDREYQKIDRVILLFRPDLCYANEHLSKYSLDLINTESLMINDFDLQVTAEKAKVQASELFISVNDSTLTDVYGNQTLLLNIDSVLGIEFRGSISGTQNPSDSHIYSMYYIINENLKKPTSDLMIKIKGSES